MPRDYFMHFFGRLTQINLDPGCVSLDLEVLRGRLFIAPDRELENNVR